MSRRQQRKAVALFLPSLGVLDGSASDLAVIPLADLTDGLGSRYLTLGPMSEEIAQVTVKVTVADGRGETAETSFALRIEPRRVVTTVDDEAVPLQETLPTQRLAR